MAGTIRGTGVALRARIWWRRLRRVLGALAALYLLASALGAYVVVTGSRGSFSVPASSIGANYETVGFASRTAGLRLSGWLFHSASGRGRSVILVHGWRGNRLDVDFAPLARSFLSEGYDVLMFDLRASGLSGGSSQTFATEEPQDLLGAYDFMQRRGYQPRRMVIMGNSMGAATVIEAAPQLGSVGALICDSAYTSVSSAMSRGLTHYLGLPGFLDAPATDFARVWGVDPSLSPIDVVGSLSTRAFLFIQATGDNLVDPASAGELRAASKDPQSRLLLLPGHSHLDTFSDDPAAFLAAVNSFIRTQLGP